MPTPSSRLPSMLSCGIASILLTLLSGLALAVPLRTADAVPDHWAQLLAADRYQLIPRPSWSTRASESNTNYSHPPTGAFLADHIPSTARSYAGLGLDLDPVVRTQVFRGKGDKSNFECHVHDPPKNINIKRVLSKVISVCESSWVSSEKVLMQLRFSVLGPPETLANGGGTFFVKMRDTFDTVLPVAAAEAVRGRDLNGNRKGDGRFDVLITINSNSPWYDGIDANCPPERYDLVTVILHEVYHNLVFAGSIIDEPSEYQELDDNRVVQTALLYKGYRTRFDSFLMNAGGCSVLGYLSDQQLSSSTGLTTNQLLADAVCNSQLYWGYNNRPIAQLYSPRKFQRQSSIYHFDPVSTDDESSLMFPTVRRGTARHTVSQTILQMQAITLDPNIQGATVACKLGNPTPTGPITTNQENTTIIHGGGAIPNIIVAEEGSVGGFPTWGIVLLAIFAFLLLAALLALCLALCLRKKKSLSLTSSIFGSRSFSPTTLGSTTRGHGTSSRTSTTSKTSLSSFGWGKKSSKSSSKKTTKPATTSSSKTKTKTSTHGKTCPSSGKSLDKCCCMFCTPITPPPPVASVHHYERDCAPVTHKCKYKCRKHCTHKSSRKHSHTCEKTTKKVCKTTTKVCCKCHCCKYEPSTCKSNSRCCKSSSRSRSSSSPKCTKSHSKSSCKRKVPPSTKPPTTRPPTTKPPTTKATSSKRATSCKPATTASCRTCKKSCKTCKPYGNRCVCRSCPAVEINIC